MEKVNRPSEYTLNRFLLYRPGVLPILAFRRGELFSDFASAAEDYEPVQFPHCSEPVYAFVPIGRIERLRSGVKCVYLIADKITSRFLLKIFKSDTYWYVIGRWFIYYPSDEVFAELGLGDCDYRTYVFLDCSSWDFYDIARIWILSSAAWFAPLACVSEKRASVDEPFIKVMLEQKDMSAFYPVARKSRGKDLVLVWLPVYELFKRFSDSVPDDLIELFREYFVDRGNPSKVLFWLRNRILSHYAKLAKAKLEGGDWLCQLQQLINQNRA